MAHPGGRPTIFTKKISEEICFRMANGESLRSICREADMPNIATVWRWRQDNEEFCKHYDKAREDQIECYANEMAEIADDSTNDFYEKALKNGEVSVVGNTEMVNRARLRVDTRKWICERMNPKRFGPKSEIDHKGDLALGILLKTSDGKQIDLRGNSAK